MLCGWDNFGHPEQISLSGRCCTQTPPESSPLEPLFKDLRVKKGGQARGHGGNKTKLWVPVSTPPLCSGAQHCLVGLGVSQPQVSASCDSESSTAAMSADGYKHPLACATVTGHSKEQEHLPASSVLQSTHRTGGNR